MHGSVWELCSPISPTDSDLLSCTSPFLTIQTPNFPNPATQFNNEVFKCTNTLLHAEAAVANRNRCSISVEAVYSEIGANTGPHPARCCCSRRAENHVGGAEHLSTNRQCLLHFGKQILISLWCKIVTRGRKTFPCQQDV